MHEEEMDVQPDSSTEQDVDTESSPVESEEATSQEATQEQDQHVPFDRFKEVNDERNYWREQYTSLAGKAQNYQQEQPKSAEPSLDALMSNLPAEQRLFMQEWSRAQKAEFNKMLAEKEGDYRATIEALASQNAKIQERLFRGEQADVKPGSKEEGEIAQLIRAGVDPDRAAWAVMGPKRVEAAKSGKQKQQQSKTQLKAKANLETEGIPVQSGVPTGEKLSYRDDLDKRLKAAGL